MKKLTLLFAGFTAALIAILTTGAGPNPTPGSTDFGRRILNAADAATARSLIGIGAGGINVLRGNGTNITLYSSGQGNGNAGLLIYSTSNNLDGAILTLYGLGTTSAAISHVECDLGKSVDYGAWGSRYGSGYGGNFVFDSYDNDNITTQFGLGYKFAGTGVYPGDSGVTSHALLTMDMTNLVFDLRMREADQQMGRSAFHFDATKGVVEFSSVSTNAFTGTGTFSSGDGATPTTITGSGTKFIEELTPGAIIYDTNNVQLIVLATNSQTSVLVQTLGGAYSVTAGMPFSVQRPSAKLPGLDTTGKGAVIMANGELFLESTGDMGVWLVRGNQSIRLAAGNGQFNLSNPKLNANPFYVNYSAPDSSFGLTASGAANLRYGLTNSTSGVVSNQAPVFNAKGLTSVSRAGFTGTGTFASGSGAPATITGSGTAFTSEVSVGSIIYDTNNVPLLVLAVNSATSILVQSLGGGSYTAVSGMPFSVQQPPGLFPGLGTLGGGFLASGDGFVRSSSNPSFYFSNGTDTWRWFAGSGNFLLGNTVGNSNPFSVSSSAADSSLTVDANSRTVSKFGLKILNTTTTPTGANIGAGNGIFWISNNVAFVSVSSDGSSVTTTKLAP